MKARARVVVSGRVQGVFFRAETQREAERNHVMGWVRNTADGKVEAVFEGERESVEKVIEFCGRGPPAARVDKMDVKWEDWKGEFRNFRIIY